MRPLPPALLAAPTANSAELWRRIAAGGIVVSGKLARQDELAQGQSLHIEGSASALLPIGGTAGVRMRCVWSGDGPDRFDCSGLVQWSMAQAGIMMPRVAADQALTGPMVPLGQLQPGDLLFYREDPAAPGVISQVAIYIANEQM